MFVGILFTIYVFVSLKILEFRSCVLLCNPTLVEIRKEVHAQEDNYPVLVITGILLHNKAPLKIIKFLFSSLLFSCRGPSRASRMKISYCQLVSLLQT